MSDEKAIGPRKMTDIPISLRPCFPEYNFEQLDLVERRDLIVERTLAYGNRQELRWLFRCYGWAHLTATNR
jgi:hypothetical protein